MKYKNQEPIPPNHHPRRYHGVGNNHVSLRDWGNLKFSNAWLAKPLVNKFRADVISIMSKLRDKQEAAA